jgi:TolB protein
MTPRALRPLALLGAVLLASAPLAAQDSLPPEAVRVGIRYTPGVRPGLVLLPGPGLDSVRAIVARDLDYSDRFELVPVPLTEQAPVQGPRTVNYEIWRRLGANYAIELVPDPVGAIARLHDVGAGTIRDQRKFTIPAIGSADARMAVHRLSDEVIRWITGQPGAAASRLLSVEGGRIWIVDHDGADRRPLTGAGERALSPAWSPDGRRFVFTLLGEGQGAAVIQDLATSQRTTVPGAGADLNITPVFSPDGARILWARSNEEGTDIFSVEVAKNCCAQRLTVGRYSDNLSPTFAPDGRRLAFVSTRPGLPQVYAMAPDGTGQELLVPFDFGATGPSHAPEWSPDGTNIVFHRELRGVPQLFVYDVTARKVRQLTSAGRNEDPTWAPDGRHIAFISDRSGRRQVWILDLESGRLRQLQSPGAARLPAWSRRLTP